MIKAICETDDRVIKVEFDATSYFEKATDECLFRLVACGLENDYHTDEVAQEAANSNKDLEDLFKYLEIIAKSPAKRDESGFDCSIDPKQALCWIKKHRLELYETIRLNEDICSQYEFDGL